MSSLRHSVTLARPAAHRRGHRGHRSKAPETFLNLQLLAICVGTWAVIIGIGELVATLF